MLKNKVYVDVHNVYGSPNSSPNSSPISGLNDDSNNNKYDKNNPNILYGLFFKHNNNLDEHIYSISYDKELLIQIKNEHYNLDFVQNSWIELVNLYEITKINWFDKIINILRCTNTITNRYNINKIDSFEFNNNIDFFCFEYYQETKQKRYIRCQDIFVIDTNKIDIKSIKNLMKMYGLDNILYEHPIQLNTLYCRSIGYSH
jgi:hypothetical protein